jgi:beta-alanine degradation protein BauB
MRYGFFFTTVLLVLPPATAPAKKITVEVDNAWVHASRVILEPHESLPFRDYPASVIVYLSDVHERVMEADGNVQKNDHKSGETAYYPSGTRAEENISDQPLEEVAIELKPGAPPLKTPPIMLDPVKLDPKYHTVDFENEHVRVLRTVLEPHIKSSLHEHPPYVVVYVTDLHTTMAISDGRLVDNVRRKGEVAWRDYMKHQTENIGSQRAMEIQIELK